MKKFFSIVAATLIAFSFASCKGGQNEPEKPTTLTFAIQVSDITATAATVSVTPSIDTVPYLESVVPANLLEEYKTVDSLARGLVEYYQSQGATYDQLVKNGYILRGKDVYTYDALTPETEYLVLACGVDSTLTFTTPIASKTFKTTKMEIKENVTITSDKAELTDYTAYGMFMVALTDSTAGYNFAITVETDTLEGEFTEEDLVPMFSGFQTTVGMFDFYKLNIKTALIEDGAVLQLTGTADVTNAVRYTFDLKADVLGGENDGAEAPFRCTKKLVPVRRSI